MGAEVLSCLDRQGILTLQFPVDDPGLAAFIARGDATALAVPIVLMDDSEAEEETACV